MWHTNSTPWAFCSRMISFGLLNWFRLLSVVSASSGDWTANDSASKGKISLPTRFGTFCCAAKGSHLGTSRFFQHLKSGRFISSAVSSLPTFAAHKVNSFVVAFCTALVSFLPRFDLNHSFVFSRKFAFVIHMLSDGGYFLSGVKHLNSSGLVGSLAGKFSRFSQTFLIRTKWIEEHPETCSWWFWAIAMFFRRE
jgi:hypothetical protein